ncbi:hypothetical protein GCE9029_03359 [Grimontia celer]|uniref:Uncharacterized protein n=1 Tax=Grimontia celer TaxID=1796497 RepID=A0A128F8P4_9GAMM|nr:hypothetical protein [Grimontia celer]CZF82651.1 hypothetical protein GCE9029_03359 [Grimontia celer]
MSKTLIYSFLLMKSSAKVRAKVLSRLNSEEKALVLKELENTPYYSAELLRSMKGSIVEESNKPLLINNSQEAQPKTEQKYSPELLDWIVKCHFLSISEKEAAAQYLDGLDHLALNALVEYAEQDHG